MHEDFDTDRDVDRLNRAAQHDRVAREVQSFEEPDRRRPFDRLTVIEVGVIAFLLIVGVLAIVLRAVGR